MTPQTLNIILAALLATAIVVIAILVLNRLRAVRRAEDNAELKNKRRFRVLQDEVERLNVLYKNLKENVKSTSHNASLAIATTANAETQIFEQRKLEAEKSDMAERNRKLWEMSLAIEKDKERMSLGMAHYLCTFALF